ncbi:17529_t:CDS:2, partial [Gigaspora margarita]
MKYVKYNAELRADANFCYKCSLQVSCKKCLAKLYSEANFCHKCGAAIKSESPSINQTTKNVENIHLKNIVDNEKHNFESRLAQQIELNQTDALVKLLRVNSQYKIESKNLKSSEKLFNDPNLNILKKDTNLNIDLNTNPNISNVPNKVVDDDIEQFLSEKTIKQEQSVINDDLLEENEALAKALNKTLRDISTKPSLFFSSANPTTIQSYLNELGSNIPQVFIDKKNKYLVEEYDIVNKTFKYIGSIYIEIEEEPFASDVITIETAKSYLYKFQEYMNQNGYKCSNNF